MVPLRSSRASVRTSAVTPRSCWLLLHAHQFACLRGGRLFRAPAVELLGANVDEFRLLDMQLVNPIDGGVVEHVRPVFCLGQRTEMLVRVGQRSIGRATGGGFLEAVEVGCQPPRSRHFCRRH
jgi:hypothetical protein